MTTDEALDWARGQGSEDPTVNIALHTLAAEVLSLRGLIAVWANRVAPLFPSTAEEMRQTAGVKD